MEYKREPSQKQIAVMGIDSNHFSPLPTTGKMNKLCLWFVVSFERMVVRSSNPNSRIATHHLLDSAAIKAFQGWRPPCPAQILIGFQAAFPTHCMPLSNKS
jgi:hypothetical protein